MDPPNQVPPNQVPPNQDLPPGLSITPAFISADEERALLTAIDASPWNDVLKRRTQHYGYTYGYKGRNLERAAPIPAWCEFLYERFRGLGLVPAGKTHPDQLIVNEYMPGQGISAHTDAAVFGDVIISLSLGSACVMVFTRGQQRREIMLSSISLLAMRGEARWNWRHEIPARKTDRFVNGNVVTQWHRTRRVSLTFRYV